LQEWWSTLIFAQKLFWVIATFFSSIFLLQAFLMLIGLHGDAGDGDMSASHDFDHDSGHDVDHGADDKISTVHDYDDTSMDDPSDSGFSFAQYFTIRNMVAFFVGFSWTGLACMDYGLNIVFTTLISGFVGVLFVTVVVLVMTGLSKLSSDGTVKLSSAVGGIARVSIEIPALYNGQGKVLITISERFREIEAVTGGSKSLKKNQEVKVVGVLSGQLVVEKTN
jgi:hypothetical protein